jgi:RNA polymerase sigma-70 factor (ECF subfamily)
MELRPGVTEFPAGGHGVTVPAGQEDDLAPKALLGAERLEKPTFDALYDEHFDFVWRNLRRLGVLEANLWDGEHFDFVWRNLRRLGVLEANLWDGAQDVFLVIHRRLGEFEPHAALRSWVYSIVVRVARQHRRTARRKPAQGFEDQEQLPDVQGIGPERGAAQSQELLQLMNLLATLDDAKREAFVLAELEGLSAPEIAEVLNVNVNTIYARIRAARQKLESAFELMRKERGA